MKIWKKKHILPIVVMITVAFVSIGCNTDENNNDEAGLVGLFLLANMESSDTGETYSKTVPTGLSEESEGTVSASFPVSDVASSAAYIASDYTTTSARSIQKRIVNSIVKEVVKKSMASGKSSNSRISTDYYTWEGTDLDISGTWTGVCSEGTLTVENGKLSGSYDKTEKDYDANGVYFQDSKLQAYSKIYDLEISGTFKYNNCVLSTFDLDKITEDSGSQNPFEDWDTVTVTVSGDIDVEGAVEYDYEYSAVLSSIGGYGNYTYIDQFTIDYASEYKTLINSTSENLVVDGNTAVAIDTAFKYENKAAYSYVVSTGSDNSPGTDDDSIISGDTSTTWEGLFKISGTVDGEKLKVSVPFSYTETFE